MIILKMYEITFKKLMLYILIKQIILLNTPHPIRLYLTKNDQLHSQFFKTTFQISFT